MWLELIFGPTDDRLDGNCLLGLLFVTIWNVLSDDCNDWKVRKMSGNIWKVWVLSCNYPLFLWILFLAVGGLQVCFSAFVCLLKSCLGNNKIPNCWNLYKRRNDRIGFMGREENLDSFNVIKKKKKIVLLIISKFFLTFYAHFPKNQYSFFFYFFEKYGFQRLIPFGLVHWLYSLCLISFYVIVCLCPFQWAAYWIVTLDGRSRDAIRYSTFYIASS